LTCSPGLLPAVSTILIPHWIIASTYFEYGGGFIDGKIVRLLHLIKCYTPKGFLVKERHFAISLIRASGVG
jgi:hypothetical protein